LYKKIVFLVLFAGFVTSVWSQNISTINVSKSVWKVRKEARKAGFSYKVINNETPLSSQLTEEKCIYEVSSKIDIGTQQITIPSDCYIKFRGKGAFVGGSFNGVLLNQDLTPENFGAIGDALTDDTRAFQNALTVTRGVLSLESKHYYLTGLLDINHTVTIRGNGADIIFEPQNKVCPCLRIQRANNVVFEDLTISSVNKFSSVSGFSRPNGSLWSNRYAIVASEVCGLTVRNCCFKDVEYAFKIDGGIGSNKNVLIDRCRVVGKVAMPVYISYTDGACFNECVFYASSEGSYHDHHIYGCSANKNHVIQNCSFFDGVGIPVHYYTETTQGCDMIYVKNCCFNNTHGATIIDSPDYGTMFVSGLSFESDIPYDNGVFRSGGKQTLIVDSATIYAPKQRLLNGLGYSTRLKNITATVGGLVYGVPSDNGLLIVEDCNITLSSATPIVYISESTASKTGNITIRENRFVLESEMEYLISVRGTTKGSIVFENNEVICKKPVSFGVYNGGINSSRLYFKSNRLVGVLKEKHTSVRDGQFSSNQIQKGQ